MGVIQGAINRTLGAAATVTMAQHAIGQKQNKLLEKQKLANDKAEEEKEAKEKQLKGFLKKREEIYSKKIGGFNYLGRPIREVKESDREKLIKSIPIEQRKELWKKADKQAKKETGYNG